MEAVVAIAILMILCGAFIVGMSNVLRVSEFEDNMLNLDKQGYRLMQELSEQLRPAILPIYLSETEKRGGTNNIFALLENSTNGFGGNEGRAWRNALRAGTYNIAYVVPIDAQDDGDSLDDNNHLEVGQIRPDGIHSLDTDYHVDSDTFTLSATGAASSLIHVNLTQFFNDDVCGLESTVFPEGIMEGSPRLGHHAYCVVRYIPQRNGDNSLVVIRESELLIDLDGDDEFTSSFNVGKLQLVYVGGQHNLQPRRPIGNTTDVNEPSSEAVQTLQVSLSGNVVLRNTNGLEPIFRLVRYNPNSIGNDGLIDLDGESGVMALYIQTTLFDPVAFDKMRPQLKTLNDGGPDQRTGFSRKYESVITLRNMAR